MSPAVTQAIAAAALSELVERGFAGISMEAVARRAKVGKSAIYRRWPSKTAMVVDVLAGLSVPQGEALDTGSLRGDVRALLAASRQWLLEPAIRAVLPDLHAASGRNPELARATQTYISAPRLRWARQVLQRSPAFAALPAVRAELAMDLLAAPAYWRVINERPIDDAMLDELTETIVSMVERAPSTPG